MSFLESLKRKTGKWKKRLGIGEEDASPSASAPSSRPSSAPPPESDNVTSGFSAAAQHDAATSNSGPLTTAGLPGKSLGAWAGVRTLLTSIESSTGAFPPLAAAIGGLIVCIDVFEQSSKQHKEYEQLRLRLQDILTDLATHQLTSLPRESQMTKSVHRLDIEAETNNVKNIQDRTSGRQLVDALAGLNDITECYRRIDGHLKRLTLNANLAVLGEVREQAVEARLGKMSPSISATYNSAESTDVQRRSCTPGTREPQIKSLLEWARDPGAGRTYWMNGMAGTGKTTITHSVCTELDETFELGASFFCSRTMPECRQVKYIIPSIAYQLARFSYGFRNELVKALESDPDACGKAPKIQYEKLIAGPLAAVQAYLPKKFIVVIDALDECENDDAVGQILDLLLSSPNTLPVRYLVSSRPEPEIHDRMVSRAGARLVLHELEPASVHMDIEAYMRDELKDIPLTEPQWKAILLRCGVLFIYASTVCRYIRQGHKMKSLNEAVHAIIQSSSTPMAHGDQKTINGLYLTILTNAFDKSEMSEMDKARAKDLLDAEHKAPEGLIALAHDASQFVSVFANHPVSQSTPHIYVSMLPFWPRSRPISAAYLPRTSGVVRPTGTAINRRQLALIATWKVSTTWVGSMSLTGDGSRLVAPSENSIEVYDTTTGESVLSLTDERAKNVKFVAVSPDGTSVVFSGRDQMAYVWDMKNGGTGTQLFSEYIYGVDCIAFSSDGSRIACGLWNGDVYLCGLQQEAGSVVRLKGHSGSVRLVVFSPDGLHLASGSDDKTIRVWNVQTGRPEGEPFKGHTGWVWSLSYSDDGSRIASASADSTIRVWDPHTGQTVLGPLTVHSSDVSSVSFSPGGAFIASGSWDHTIRVYDAHTGHTVLGPLHGHTDAVNRVMYSPDGTRLYSCSDDGTVRTWNVQDRGTSDALSTASGVSTPIWSVRYSYSGRHVVSGSEDGTMHVWDARTGELVRGPLHGHKGGVASVDYSPDDQYIASGSGDSTLRLWDASTGNDIHGPMRGHSKDVNCVRFSPDGSALVSGSDDGTVRMWDVRTGQQTKQLLKDDSRILSVGMSSDGRRVIFGSSDGWIRVVDVHTGDTLVGPIKAHTSQVSSMEMWADGMRFVSGSYDKSVQIWDGMTEERGAVCGDDDWSHSDVVSSVCVSPNGLYVASASYDGTVCVWDGQNGKRILGPLRGHTNDIFGVQFSPDGSRVVSCSVDGAIRFWDVSGIGAGKQGVTRAVATGGKAKANSDDRAAPDQWLLGENGWMVDSHGQLLVWVPPDLRRNLERPPTSLSIGDRTYFHLETEGWEVGDDWIHCYRT
ncbi:putative WD repeat-containing protein alr2800 OS=Nostoc sp, (strain PCC 7120 / UTEX 2576) GN=alr2800 PE=4 SV=1 [Rhizoctonia solani AG-1 IB]|uniref:Putative WD repeat-containing protein alr2800 n=1 Tax=Thanatephorus cucumeris (strain AG1-IB / isolate 7/3/14) TaxID=1108050 RepID=A0A0B7FWG0_THACB|nr:putative WD repeat-containing protein alr2800 OS=Nostoc sp, (strain PCC 7120 / UTEX 2576) GN=alr2800 PE=4 SV=1 [Rhizoctonia solani AG-1 IB]